MTRSPRSLAAGKETREGMQSEGRRKRTEGREEKGREGRGGEGKKGLPLVTKCSIVCPNTPAHCIV